MRQNAWAEELARKLLEVPLPRRWAHVQGVATRARHIAHLVREDADLLETAAWLHDIGYSPELADTDFHPLDGARYLRDTQHAEPVLCSLVANHSFALAEATERGLAAELATEFPVQPGLLLSALTYCDLTTSPDGERVSITWRITEARTRYGPGHPVTRALRHNLPQITGAVRTVSYARYGWSLPAR
jgi:hypothetical protein